MSFWVRLIIFVNIAVHFWTMQNPGVRDVLAFVPVQALREPWTIFTYMFVHSQGLGHILFNMLSLFFFGPQVEQRLGGRRFLLLYFIGGFTGALASAVITPRVGLIGASAATYAVFFGFAKFWPRAQVLIWGVFPVEARVLIVVMTALSLFQGGTGIMAGNVAHFAHLGGFLGGWLAMRSFGVRSALPRAVNTEAKTPRTPPAAEAVERWKQIPLDRLHPVNRGEAERVLAKLATGGPGSLTADEREFLDRFSAI